MCARMQRKIGNIAPYLIIFLVATYSLFIFATNSIVLIESPYSGDEGLVLLKNSGRMLVYVSGPSSVYTATIKNSVINGTVIIGNESNVLFENVTFTDLSLIIEDNAKVTVRNYTVSAHLTIVTLNNSILKLEGGVGGGDSTLAISAYGFSEVYMQGSFEGINIDGYENSRISIYGNITSSGINLYANSSVIIVDANIGGSLIWMYDESNIMLSNAYDDSSSMNIYIYGEAVLNVSNSNLSSSFIDMHDFAFITAKESLFYDISLDEDSRAYLNGVSMNTISARGDSIFTIVNSHLYRVNTYISTSDGKYYAAGQIINSTVTEVSLNTAGITYLVDSNIETLYYNLIHNGTLSVNQTHADSTSNYPNYVNDSSTVTNVHLQSIYIAREAISVTINRSWVTVYLIDVASAKIYNAGTVFSAHSNITIMNTDVDSIHIYGHDNSNILIENVSVNILDVTLSCSSLKINGTQINSSSDMDIYNSSVTTANSLINRLDLYTDNSSWILNNTVLNNTDRLDIHGSSMNFYGSEANATAYWTVMYIRDSVVVIENSALHLMADTEFILENDSYTMVGGIIVNNTGVTSGIVGLGTNDLSQFLNFISVDLYGSDLIIENYSIYTLFGSYSEINLMNNSNLTLRDVIINSFYITVYDTSVITLENASSIEEIYGENATVDISNAEIGYVTLQCIKGSVNGANISSISAFEVDLSLNNTNISDIEVTTGDLEITFSNVSEVSLGSFDYLLFQNIIFDVSILVNNSKVNVLSSMNYGSITIDNSKVGDMRYALTTVNIMRSQMNSTMRNYLINTSGEVVIDSNTIPAGSCHSLLTTDGSTMIGHIVEAIVTNQSALNLTIKNSEYIGLFGIGDSIFNVLDSNISIIMIFSANKASIRNTLVNASFMEDAAPIFLDANSVEVYNIRVLGAGIAVMADYASIEDAFSERGIFAMNSTVLYENVSTSSKCYSQIYNSNITIMRSSISSYDIELSFSDVLIEDSLVGTLEVFNSTLTLRNLGVVSIIGKAFDASITNITVLNNITVGDKTNLEIWDSTISRIMPTLEYVSSYYYWYSVHPKDITLSVHNSEINASYIHYNIVDGSGTLEYSEPLDTSFNLATIYENTNITDIWGSIIDIAGLSTVNIVGFNNSDIVTLRIFGVIDRSPPTIVILNDTTMEYEYGLPVNISFQTLDETPRDVWVLINSSEVFRESYTSSETTYITLSDYITAAGYYIVQIYADDRFENEAYINLSVTVYPAEPPVIVSSPPDLVNTTVGKNVSLSWIAEDRSPNTYTIYLNGTEVASGSWESGISVVFNFTPTEVGKYNVTIVFTDALGQSSTNTVMVSVTKPGGPSGMTIVVIVILVAVIIIALITAITVLRRRKIE